MIPSAITTNSANAVIVVNSSSVKYKQPTIWFVCKWCKRAYQERQSLIQHKRKSHLHLLPSQVRKLPENNDNLQPVTTKVQDNDNDITSNKTAKTSENKEKEKNVNEIVTKTRPGPKSSKRNLDETSSDQPVEGPTTGDDKDDNNELPENQSDGSQEQDMGVEEEDGNDEQVQNSSLDDNSGENGKDEVDVKLSKKRSNKFEGIYYRERGEPRKATLNKDYKDPSPITRRYVTRKKK